MEMKISKYKAVEAEIVTDDDGTYFSFNVRWTRNQDHAGFFLSFSLWKLYVWIDIHDTRHWWNDKNRWFNEGEQEALMNEEE